MDMDVCEKEFEFMDEGLGAGFIDASENLLGFMDEGWMMRD